MTAAGLTIMIVSVSSVVALVTFCVIRVLSLPPREDEHLRSPLGIDTGDLAQPD